MKLIGLDGISCDNLVAKGIPTTTDTTTDKGQVIIKNYNIVTVSKQNLAEQGLRPTEDFLTENSIPYQKVLGTQGAGDSYKVGSKTLDTFIGMDKQSQVLASLKAELLTRSTTTTDNKLTASIPTNNKSLAALGLGFLGLVFVFSIIPKRGSYKSAS